MVRHLFIPKASNSIQISSYRRSGEKDVLIEVVDFISIHDEARCPDEINELTTDREN